MATEREIGFLSGLIEGEGSITLSRDNRTGRGRNGLGSLYPRIQIVNTSIALLQKAMTILDAMGVTSRVGVEKPRRNNKTGYNQTKSCYCLYVSNHSNLLTLISIILPDLICKHEQAVLMLEFLSRRDGRSSCTERDFQIANSISVLNGNKKYRIAADRPYPVTDRRHRP